MLLPWGPFFVGGAVFGWMNFEKYAFNNILAPTGTVIFPTLFILLGFQFTV
jgi:hypothetical protein